MGVNIKEGFMRSLHVKVPVPSGPAIELNDLAGLVVLCGKNSSGKSTVMRGLMGEECLYGFSQEEALSLLVNMIPSDAQRRHAEIWRGIFQRVLSPHRAIYPDFTDLEQQFNLAYAEEARFGRHVVPRNAVTQMLTNIRNRPAPKRFLIDAKRAVPPRMAIQTQSEARSDGTTLPNILFRWKNSARGSADWTLYRNVERAFKDVTGGFEFEVALASSNNNFVQLQFKRGSSGWSPADECGQGLSDALLMIHSLLDPANEFVLIEEPENHLHPEMQERLARFADAQKDSRSTLFSTHSPSIIEAPAATTVYLTRFVKHIEVENLTSTAKAIADLGYSVPEGVTADALLLVEGPSDRPIIDELAWQYGLRESANVRVYPLGGDIMDQVDLEVFTSKYRCWAIVDRDEGSAPVRERFSKRCDDLGVPVLRTNRYALENYVPLERFRQAFGDQVPQGLTEIDPHKPVEIQLGFSTKRRHRELASVIKKEDLIGTDIEAMFVQIRQALDALDQEKTSGTG